MFLTKKDVDKHCQEVINRCKSERDKNLRCLNLAQQYYNVRDYESARHYVTLFLSVKDDSPIAHKLLGQCHEHFNEKEKALTEYKHSLSLDPKQPELYLKVCELYADSNVIVDKNEAKYWHEKGEIQFPYHPAIHKLKQKMFAIGDNQSGKSVESALLNALTIKPHDPTVHIQLLTFYLENGRVKDAYEQAFKSKSRNLTSKRKSTFIPNLNWYQCVVHVCKSFKNQLPTSLNEEFYGNYLLVLERSLALSVQDVKMHRKSIPECVALLANFDELIAEASALNHKSERFIMIMNHMYGQLCFHMLHVLYRKAKWEDQNWPKMVKLISPLLLLSSAESFDISKVKEDGTFSQIFMACIPVNVCRNHQSAYISSILAKESQKLFLKEIFHTCGSNYWRESVCEIIYSTSTYKTFSKSSFFMKFDGFSNFPAELPKNVTNHIDNFIHATEIVYPASLHHSVWIGVHYLAVCNVDSICSMVLPLKYSAELSDSLQFSHTSSSTFAENLCKIDVEAFLHACVYCAKSSLDQQIDRSKPLASYILPADVSKPFCSPDQDLWWEYVNQMLNQNIAEENYNRARSIIQGGIESVRLVGNNMLPLPLLVLLGRTFANKATVESDSVRASALESRALLYWKAALPLLEDTLRSKSRLSSSKSLFDYQAKIITKVDATKLIAEGKRFVGMQQIKEENYSDAMFSNESYDETKNVMPVVPLYSNYHSTDDGMLKAIYEQNTKIMDKLETLFNKQELLSSNQLQLFETVSAISKKLDDVLIMPNDCYLDALSSNEPASPVNASQVSHVTANKSVPVMPLQTTIAPIPTAPLFTDRDYYSMPSNVKTSFPILPFGDPSAVTPLAVSTSVTMTPFLRSCLMGRVPLWGQSVPQNGQLTSDTKESFATTDSSITSSSLFKVSVPSTTTSLGAVTPLLKPMGSEKSVDSNHGKLTMNNDHLNLSKSSDTPLKGWFTPMSQIGLKRHDSSDDLLSTETLSLHNSNLSPSVFSPSTHVHNEQDDSDDAQTVEHDPIPNFKPIIPLPDEVAVKTGEEQEEILFENRAKLYRFADKEWKERGIGPLKILKNPATSRVRVLMRREVVHKICANHILSEDMKLMPMNNSDRAWFYCAPDFADETMNIEKLCVKFATPEIAGEFFKVFNENKSSLQSSVTDTPVQLPVSVASPITKPSATIPNTSSPPKFIEKCKKSIISPPIINLPTAKEEPTDLSKTNLGGFTFNAKPILTANATEEKEPAKMEEKKSLPFASFGGFSLESFTKPQNETKLFSSVPIKSPAPTATVPSAPKENASMLFSSVQNAIDFSSLSKNADVPQFPKSENFKGFAGAGAPVFGSSFAKMQLSDNTSTSSFDTILKNMTVKTKTSSPKSVESAKDRTNDDDFVPTAEFKPAISLPDLVEVRTGEEGSDVLYEEQCKLFRYVDDQWKERGVGKMKILRDPISATIRLLMRRDQVHKVCCNQRLTAEHVLKPLSTTDKAWSWVGPDFSEGELKQELLCARFKTVEQSAAFKEAFENAQKQLLTSSEQNVTSSTASTIPSTLPSLSEMFKRDQTAWTCETCYISNKKEDSVCVACEQPKDGVIKSESSKSSIFSGSYKFSPNPTTMASSSTTFSFGTAAAAPAGSFSFGMPAGSSTSANFASSSDNNSSGLVFAFGNSSSQKSESGGLLFGNTSFHFGDKSTEAKNDGENLVNETKRETNSEAASGNFSIFGGTGNIGFAKGTETSGAFSNFSFKLENKADVASNNNSPKLEKKADVNSKQSSSDEVEFVSETKISEADKQYAVSLMLPPNYLAYKYTDKNCPGCAGCDDEDPKDVKSAGVVWKNNVISSNSEISSASSKNENTSNTNPVANDKVGFVFGGSSETSSWLNKSTFTFENIFNRDNALSTNAPLQNPAGDDESDEEKDNSLVSNDHEPYFEPVVSLPNLVETKTGEEDETIEFSERSKIYRYDEATKEWKDRGVGELKILFHPVNKTYRLLLRREQVHKVVLNQRITANLSLQPMPSSNSWCWYGMNLPEGENEPVVEKLAARFKTEEITSKFHDVVSGCIEKLIAENAHETTNQTDEYEVSGVSEEGEYDENIYDESCGEHDYYVDEQAIEDAMEDAETEILFDCPVTLKIFEGDNAVDYQGIIRLVRKNPYDPETVEKPYIEFSTPDIPSLYKAEIDDNSQTYFTDDYITIVEGDLNTERKVTVHFEEIEKAQEFFDMCELIK